MLWAARRSFRNIAAANSHILKALDYDTSDKQKLIEVWRRLDTRIVLDRGGDVIRLAVNPEGVFQVLPHEIIEALDASNRGASANVRCAGRCSGRAK